MESRPTRRASRAPTMRDVAARAKVSMMTVSRVINGGNYVSPTTRETVMAAVAALHYAPNPAARSLAGSDQIRIALLYSNPSAAYLSEFLIGGLDQARRRNVQLVVEKCEPDRHEADVARRLVANRIDGMILPPPLCDSAPVIAALRETGTPAVAVATGQPPAGLCTVSIDDKQAAFAMTRHIASLGHQRIAFILGNPSQTASARRYEGYRDALAASGLPLVDELVVPGLFTYHSGLDATEQLLNLAEPPSAIFASNDDMAAAAVAVAHQRGLHVPGDLTVCGFDDTALATTIWPELTTIHQPIIEMSRAAIDLLLGQVRARRAIDKTNCSRLLLDFELVRRQSDAAPRKRPAISARR